MTVNLSAKFTKAERDLFGLDAITKELLENPLERRYVVAVVEPKFAKEEYAEGTKTPTVKVVHIEPMTEDEDEQTAKDLLDRAYRKRTNRETSGVEDALPFDQEPE